MWCDVDCISFLVVSKCSRRNSIHDVMRLIESKIPLLVLTQSWIGFKILAMVSRYPYSYLTKKLIGQLILNILGY